MPISTSSPFVADGAGLLQAVESVAAEPSLSMALGRVAAMARQFTDAFGAAIAVADMPQAPARLVVQQDMTFPDSQEFALTPAQMAQPLILSAGDFPVDLRMQNFAQVMLHPIRRPGHPLLLLLLFFDDVGAARCEALLPQVEALLRAVVHPLISLTLAERIAHLTGLIEGHPPEHIELLSEEEADRPLHVVSLAMSRLTRTQALTLNQINAILGADWDKLDSAIVEALTHICAQSGADRAVISDLSDGLDARVSHGWSSPELGPLSSTSVGPWSDLTPSAVAELAEGKPVCWSKVAATPTMPFQRISDGHEAVVICPIREAGRLTRLMSFEFRSVRHGFFLPGEVQLFQSIAHVIGAALTQRRVSEEHQVARDAVQMERLRLQSTLSALPDLVAELDPSGRFVAHYSQGNPVLAQIGDRLIGRTLEEVAPPEVVKAGRALLEKLTVDGRVESLPFLYDIGDGDFRWIKALAVHRDPHRQNATSSTIIMILRDVTREVMQAEEISRLSEVAKRTQNLVVMTDDERRITWVNASFERLTGWQLHELVGQLSDDLFKGETPQDPMAGRIRASLSAGDAVQVEAVLVARNGRQHWVAMDIQPIRDAQGDVSGYIGVLADVTQRREHEAALASVARQAEEARARLVAAVNSLEDGFVIFDKDGVLVLCNERYRETLPGVGDVIRPGSTIKQILQRGLELKVYKTAEGREEEWLENRLNQMLVSGSSEVELSNGRWLRLVDHAIPDGGWVGLRIDITELKHAEALARSDREAAMDVAHDGMAISGPDGALLYANSAFLGIFCVDAAIAPLHRQWREVVGADVADHLQISALPSLHAGEKYWRGIVDVSSDRASALQVEISLTLRDDGAMVWVVRDLTDALHHEQERTKLREELQLAQRREVIGQLAAGLAHDFNNLIAAISGSALLIKDEASTSAPVRAHAERILKSATRAEGMVRKLLAIGARSRQFQRLPLAPVLNEAADLLRPALPRSMRLSVAIDEGQIKADIEPTDLVQVILNLGVNARDALFGRAHTSRAAEIRLSLCRASGTQLEADRPMAQVGQFDPLRDYASICVSDSGDGIAEEQAQTIFTPYFSTKGTKGTGLGLSIVSSVIQGMGGVVRLHRSALGGAEFRIFLPLPSENNSATVVDDRDQLVLPLLEVDHDALLTDEPVTADTHANPERATPLAGKSILVVDDVEEVLEVLAAVLERAGAEVAPTSDPEAALEVLAEDPHAFDLVITDFDMGGLTGADLARQIRAMRADMPVILITALTDWQSRDRAENGETAPLFDAVIGKPVPPEMLVSSANSALLSRKN